MKKKSNLTRSFASAGAGLIRQWKWGVYLAAGLLLFSACGYRMAGSGNLPAGVEHFAVHVLENRTSETGLEMVFTNALVNEFNSRRPGTIVNSQEAPAFLDGTIVSLGWNTIARSGAVTALERRVYAVMSVVLTDKQGHVIWQSGPIRGMQAYRVNGNDSDTDGNKRQAINQLAERLAEDTLLRMTTNF